MSPPGGPFLVRKPMRYFLLLAALVSQAAAAPAPRYRAKPPLVPTTGVWDLRWGSVVSPVTLGRDGRYEAWWGGKPWYGSWHWDAKARTLHVQETCDGRETWCDWSAALGDDLAGKAAWLNTETDVALTPRKPR